MHKPRSPEAHELQKVVSFLNDHLRQNTQWNINQEYPTALTPQNAHNMSIIEENEQIVSHAVIKPIITKTPQAIFRIGAIGSVVTHPDYRNQGLSSQNLQNCLTKATAQNCDLVVLWTDKFDYYRKFGFELAGMEYSYEFNQAQPIENKEARFVKGSQVDPNAILKLYNQHTVNSVRTADEVAKFMKIPNSNIYTLWSPQNQLLAYSIEGKGADLTNYIHEWGGSVQALIDLWSFMVRTENKTYRIIVPQHSQNLRRRLMAISPTQHEGFLGMIRIQDFNSISQKIKKAFRAEGLDQFVLEKQHGEVVIGYGSDLYTLNNESDLVRILFGPITTSQLNFMKTETQEILAKVLPMPLWIWGWDSI